MISGFLSRFSRITSAGRVFIPQLDGLRFIAIAWVFAFHIAVYVRGKAYPGTTFFDSRLGDFFDAGHLGVLLFFCISGFILALPFAEAYHDNRPAMPLKKYFIRRLTRLEPPYLIHLFLLLVLLLALPGFSHSTSYSEHVRYLFPHVGASSVYLHQLIFHERPMPNNVLWSLEIEVQFYLLAPLLSQIFRWKSMVGRRAVLIAVICVGFWANTRYHDNFFIFHTLAGFLQYFLIGFLFADQFVAAKHQLRPSVLWDIGVIGVFAAMFLFRGVAWELCWATPFFMYLILRAGFQGRFTLRILSLAVISTIGGMCYTIYMYHYLLISLLGRLTIHGATGHYTLDLMIQLAVLSLLVLAICGPLFLLFERPFMARDWHTKLWRRLRGAQASPELASTKA